MVVPYSQVMDETEADYEEELFDVEEISNIVKYSVETSLSTCDYQNNKVSVHNNTFCLNCLLRLDPGLTALLRPVSQL